VQSSTAKALLPLWLAPHSSPFLVSTFLRKGKPSFADMTNAARAGGVAVGATCNLVSPAGAFAIGLLAGSLVAFAPPWRER
jgi:ammonia channel protein AmtB